MTKPSANPWSGSSESARYESKMGGSGVATLAQDVVRLLSNRLLLQKDLIDHPEIADEDVSDPIVIVGNPRTGTTKLQRMLGAHPRIQSVKLWQILFPGRLPGDSDPACTWPSVFNNNSPKLSPPSWPPTRWSPTNLKKKHCYSR